LAAGPVGFGRGRFGLFIRSACVIVGDMVERQAESSSPLVGCGDIDLKKRKAHIQDKIEAHSG